MGTPQTRWREMHQSGRRGDHVGDALFAPGGHPADLLDGFERALAEIVALHADEPLLGGAEDGRVVAAPAVRIGVGDLLEAAERVVRFQDFDDDGVGFPNGFADDFFGQASRGAFGVIEAAGGIDRAEGRDAVLAADDVVFLSVAGGGVDGAGALFERDVIGEDAEGIAIEERMAEDGVLRGRRRGIAPTDLRDRASRIFRR